MDWAIIIVPAVVAGIVGLLGGGGLMSVFRDRRDAKRVTREQASEARAKFRATCEKDIELAKELGRDDDANRLGQEYLDFDARWRAQQDLESTAPREVQATGPPLAIEDVSRLLELLKSTQGLPPNTVSAE